MRPKLKKVLQIVLILITVTATGCTIGIKEKRELVFISPVPIPEAAKGIPMIATNDLVKLSVINKPDSVYLQNIGGYVVVDPWFFDLLLKAYNKQNPPAKD